MTDSSQSSRNSALLERAENMRREFFCKGDHDGQRVMEAAICALSETACISMPRDLAEHCLSSLTWVGGEKGSENDQRAAQLEALLNAAPQELPAVSSASRQATGEDAAPPNKAGQRTAGPVRDSAQQPAGAASDDKVRAALEELLRHCDANPEGETAFERAVIAGRVALCAPSAEQSREGVQIAPYAEASAPETPGSWEERCAALYQVIGCLGSAAGVFETSTDVSDALDVAAGRGDVEKLLPWPKDLNMISDLEARCTKSHVAASKAPSTPQEWQDEDRIVIALQENDGKLREFVRSYLRWAPSATASQDAQDAARYRWWRERWTADNDALFDELNKHLTFNTEPAAVDEAIDAAMRRTESGSKG